MCSVVALFSRTPRKRDSAAVSRRSSSREQPAVKKVHTERREEVVKQGRYSFFHFTEVINFVRFVLLPTMMYL